jgi:hypothetical protein
MMRETVANISKFTLFDILFDRIEWFLFGNLHFRICPPWNFDDHVKDTVIGISEEGHIVKSRNDATVVFDINTMFLASDVVSTLDRLAVLLTKCVGAANDARSVF